MDYSKWDKLANELSDEDEPDTRRPNVTRFQASFIQSEYAV